MGIRFVVGRRRQWEADAALRRGRVGLRPSARNVLGEPRRGPLAGSALFPPPSASLENRETGILSLSGRHDALNA